MAFDFDHKLHVMFTKGDPALDPPLTLRSVNGDIVLDGNLQVVGTAEIAGVAWPNVNDLADPSAQGKILVVAAGPSIGLMDPPEGGGGGGGLDDATVAAFSMIFGV